MGVGIRLAKAQQQYLPVPSSSKTVNFLFVHGMNGVHGGGKEFAWLGAQKEILQLTTYYRVCST